jgi:Raf kinase inhibitor-like YbhB/YbcL family protein
MEAIMLKFRLSGGELPDGGLIPVRYACDGEDLSPLLRWSDPPEATRSLALLVADPDAPQGLFTYWVFFALSSDLRDLAEGRQAVSTAGLNDFERLGWSGHCPPPRHGERRSTLLLRALDLDTLELPSGATREAVERAMAGQVLDEASWMGRYSR